MFISTMLIPFILMCKYCMVQSSVLSRIFGASQEDNFSGLQSAPSARCENKKEEKLCLTEECIHISSAILSKMDQSVDPCNNFYQFACGSWQQDNAHQISDEVLLYASNLDEMPSAINQILGDLIKGKRKIDDSFYETRAYYDLSNLYYLCMDTKRVKEEGYAPVRKLLQSLKEFHVGRPFDKEKWNMSRALVELLQFSAAPLFDVTLDTNLNDSSSWMAALSVPKHYGLIPTELIGSSFRKDLLRNLLKNFKVKSREKKISEIFNEINDNAFLLEVLSKAHPEEDPKKFISSLKYKLSQEHNRKSFGKPTKYTSFFSRVIETDSVNYENKIDVKDNYLVDTNDKPEDNYIYDLSLDDFGGGLQLSNEIKGNAIGNETTVSVNESVVPTEPDRNSYAPVIANEVNDTGVLGNTTDSMIEMLTEAFDKLYSNSSSSNETEGGDTLDIDSMEYHLLLEEAGNALNLLESLGIYPELTRKELYDGIQEELESVRIEEIRSLLNLPEFEDLFVYFDAEKFAYTSDAEFPGMIQLLTEEAIVEILTMISELKKIEPSEREKLLAMQEGRVFNTLRIKEIQKMFPEVQWEYVMNAILKGPLTDESEVLVFYIDYINDLFKLLRTKEPWVVHYTMLTLFTYDVLKELVTAPETTPRDDFCIAVIKETMQEPLAHMYLKYLGADAINDLRVKMQPIINAVKKQAKETLLSSPILNAEDKVAAKRKVEEMHWEIGGLDALYNISHVEEQHYEMEFDGRPFLEQIVEIYKLSSRKKYELFPKKIDLAKQIWKFTVKPYTVNAFHIQTTNSIVVPEAFFKPPYYYPGSPSYITFGGAGVAFAHEMMHAFDFTGRLFDHKGTFNDPFSPQMKNEIERKIQCFNDMIFKGFSSVEIIEGIKVALTVDNNVTINENFADIAGLDIAYKSYLEYAKNTVKDEPILPGLPYTREQLFFIGYAQPYCAILPGIAKIILMEVDEHLIHDIRINSVLLNYPEFSEIFNCGTQHKMTAGNLYETCPIF